MGKENIQVVFARDVKEYESSNAQGRGWLKMRIKQKKREYLQRVTQPKPKR